MFYLADELELHVGTASGSHLYDLLWDQPDFYEGARSFIHLKWIGIGVVRPT